jgi:hypothetical protein
LGHHGQHRVAGIAEQRHPARRPALHRGAVVKRPDERFVDGAQDGAHLGVPTVVGGERVGDVALIGPRLSGPGVLLEDRDEVDQLPVSDEVVHEVPAGAQPDLRGHLQLQVGQPVGRDQPPVRDTPGEVWVLGAE